MSILTGVTSFANMILSANRIYKTIAIEQQDTGKQYLGCPVTETFPNGSTREAIIRKIEWCASCGLGGNWLLWIEYTDDKSFVSGAWVGKDVLTLSGGE